MKMKKIKKNYGVLELSSLNALFKIFPTVVRGNVSRNSHCLGFSYFERCSAA